ncbi:MAG: FHA domain-containing protein [Lachnospiraceae bacterium]|nr:FHA domain-containing protein [Lachnospiraceae bacterium]
MAIIRCVNGHFYDTAKSQDCPYCRKRELENEQIQKVIQNAPYIRASEEINHEAVTVAMDSSGEELNVMLGRLPRPGMSGISVGDDPVTVALFSGKRGNAYVTGWLVSVEGPEKGRDYRIRHGMNWVGSSAAMDIVIYGDASVAAVRHCSIAYDRKANRFYVIAGTGTATYLNGEILTDSREIKLGDEVGIGRSKYEFIPFCREGHTWDE